MESKKLVKDRSRRTYELIKNLNLILTWETIEDFLAKKWPNLIWVFQKIILTAALIRDYSGKGVRQGEHLVRGFMEVEYFGFLLFFQ